jgi:hypothetical protein
MKAMYACDLPLFDKILTKSLQLNEPEHQIFTLGASESDELLTQKVQEVVAKILEGQYGGKVLLKIENTKE